MIEGKKEVLVDLSRILTMQGNHVAAYVALLTAQEFEVDVDDSRYQGAMSLLNNDQIKQSEADAVEFIEKLKQSGITHW